MLDRLKAKFGKAKAKEGEITLSPNLALTMKEDDLTTIGSICIEEYKKDYQSYEPYRKRAKKWMQLFSSELDPKTKPWPNCSNTNVPLLPTACIQFQARAYDALIPEVEIAKILVLDKAKKDVGERRQKYLNCQLEYKMPNWKTEQDAMLLQLAIFGAQYKKINYDHTLQQVRSSLLGVGELVIPYGTTLEKSPRKSHAYIMTTETAQTYMDKKIFRKTEVDEQSATSRGSEIDEAKQQATSTQDNQDNKLFLNLVEQVRYIEVAGKVKEYVVLTDYNTERVLSIQENLAINTVNGMSAPAVQYVEYVLIPNFSGTGGFGFGHLLERLNESANAMLNQITDAGTLANLQGGFINKRSGVKKGDLTLKMGEFKEVDAASDDIRKALYFFDFKGPSSVLSKVLNDLIDFSRQVTSVSDSMMGELPSADTTATTMMSTVEQGLKVFNSIHKRVHGAFTKELQAIEALNAVYVDDALYEAIQDSTTLAEDFISGSDDYTVPVLDIRPVSDPRITSQAEMMSKAQRAYEFGLTNPLIANNPEAVLVLTNNMLKVMDAHEVALIIANQGEVATLPPVEEGGEVLG
jgi:hypothetical protein